jgi:hypothetical protein
MMNMTLRETYAGLALQALLGSETVAQSNMTPTRIAEDALDCADALIRLLDKTP